MKVGFGDKSNFLFQNLLHKACVLLLTRIFSACGKYPRLVELKQFMRKDIISSNKHPNFHNYFSSKV